MRWRDSWNDWPQYAPVGRRIDAAKKRAAKRASRAGRQPEPVRMAGRDIAKTFWGRSWCRSLEGFSDFANRLPRGRTYARNGSVVDLAITRGRVEAVVAGSQVYDVAIAIAPLSPAKWRAIKTDCATSIGSLLDLLTGRLAHDVMQRLVKPGEGMLPSPREISIACNCPDGASVCKHLAAVFYGIGHRLDTQPELLFVLRGVDQTELVAAATKDSVSQAVRSDAAHALADGDLAAIFGIELGESSSLPPAAAPSTPRRGPAGKRAGPGPRTPKRTPTTTRRPVTKRKPATKKKPAPKRKPVPKRKR